MSHTCLVFFRRGKASLETAAVSLAKYGLTTVSSKGDHLFACRPDSPTYQIGLARGPHVAAEATEIAANTPHEGEMRKCEERFEITIDNLDEALDEINTLMEVQSALQDASDGYLFLPWSGSLSEPWHA